MEVILNGRFARDSKVEGDDVPQMKKALNRLGYYMPPLKAFGVTGIPDSEVFAALKKFQQDHGLESTERALPGDRTIDTMNVEIGKPGKGAYIWRTVGDGKVRASHAELNGTTRLWSQSPDPGENYRCRCWAEPTDIYDPPIEPVYPVEAVAGLAAAVAIESGVGAALQLIRRNRQIQNQIAKGSKLTDHGALRLEEREISFKDIEEAITTAKQTGNMIDKIGKYGTPQRHYVGKNGITVIEETTGRNAGKIITSWRSK